MTECEPIVTVGVESLPEDLINRLKLESSLGSQQLKEVFKILNSMLYMIALEDDLQAQGDD